MTYFNNEYDKPLDNYNKESLSASVLYDKISFLIDKEKENSSYNSNEMNDSNESNNYFNEIYDNLYSKQNDCIEKINKIFNTLIQKSDWNSLNFDNSALNINTSDQLLEWSDRIEKISINELTQILGKIKGQINNESANIFLRNNNKLFDKFINKDEKSDFDELSISLNIKNELVENKNEKTNHNLEEINNSLEPYVFNEYCAEDVHLNQQPFDFNTIIDNESLSTREYYNYEHMNNSAHSQIKYYDIENLILQKLNHHINYLDDVNRLESEYNQKMKTLNEQLENKKNELDTRKRVTDELDFVEIEIFRKIVFKLARELKNMNIELENLKISYSIHDNQCNEFINTEMMIHLNNIRKEYRNKVREYFKYLKEDSNKISKILQECMILNGFMFIVSRDDFIEMEKIISFNKNIKINKDA